MAKQLYQVTISTDVLVLADDYDEALLTAQFEVVREIDEWDVSVSPRPVTDKSQIVNARDWLTAIPFGEQEDGAELTVAQILGLEEDA